jgi:hypothetical protein
VPHRLFFRAEAVAAAVDGEAPHKLFFLRLLSVLTAVGRSPAFYRSSWCRIDYFFLAAVACANCSR